MKLFKKMITRIAAVMLASGIVVSSIMSIISFPSRETSIQTQQS